MKFVTLQFKKRANNPFPKLYVCKKEDVENLLKGLPCAMVFDRDTGPRDAAWWNLMSSTSIEEMGVRAPKRQDCVDAHTEKESKRVEEFIQETLGISYKEATYIVPVYQRHRTWAPVDLPSVLQVSETGDSTIPMFLYDKQSHVHKVVPGSGPPLKLPDGTISPTVCAVCPMAIQNMTGQCTFGDEVCMTSMVVPGKSQLLSNIEKYARQVEYLHGDTHEELPCISEIMKGAKTDGV